MSRHPWVSELAEATAKLKRSLERKTGRPPTRPQFKKCSCVYFIQCGGADGPIKVGFTDDLTTRLGLLQVGCPYELIVRGAVEGSPEDEHAAHIALAPWRIRGEWFDAHHALRFFEQAAMDRRKVA